MVGNSQKFIGQPSRKNKKQRKQPQAPSPTCLAALLVSPRLELPRLGSKSQVLRSSDQLSLDPVDFHCG